MDATSITANSTARAAEVRPSSNRSVRQTKASPVVVPPPPLIKPRRLAAIICTVAALALMVSLKHLADGIQRITRSSTLEGWACAMIFDASYCVAEITLVLVPALGLTTWHKRAAYSVVVTCTITSIVLNCLAFREHATTWIEIVLATTWGTIVPLLVLVLAYLATSVLVAARR